MSTFRFTYKTKCGKTDTAVETGDTLDEARQKAKLHIENKHSEMTLLKSEYECGGFWFRC